MPRHDWLVGRDRRSEAAERIYAAAAELIARRGYDAFTIEALAAQVHCSPATIYRQPVAKLRFATPSSPSKRRASSTQHAKPSKTSPVRIEW